MLAHEVEHIDHYHCGERVQVEAQLRKLDLDVVGALAEIPVDFWQAGYHKDEGFEADREACISPCSPATPPMARWIFLSASRNCATSM